MGARQGLHIIDFSARRGPPMEVTTIPGGDSPLFQAHIEISLPLGQAGAGAESQGKAPQR